MKMLTLAVTLAMGLSAALGAYASENEVPIRMMQMNETTTEQVLNQAELPDAANQDARALVRNKVRTTSRYRDGDKDGSSDTDGDSDGVKARDRDRDRIQGRTHQEEHEIEHDMVQQQNEYQYEYQFEHEQHHPGGTTPDTSRGGTGGSKK